VGPPCSFGPAGVRQSWERLAVLEFTSQRQRMSVALRDPDSGRVLLVCKGADSQIFKRLRKGAASAAAAAATSRQLEDFAQDGLRTLAVASVSIEEAAWRAWKAKFDAACADLAEIDKRKNRQDNAIDDLMDEIEWGLELLGATAIEDKLQEGVPDTIADLARAGIKLWVLTGDKKETAINIGFACQLLTRAMNRIEIDGMREVGTGPGGSDAGGAAGGDGGGGSGELEPLPAAELQAELVRARKEVEAATAAAARAGSAPPTTALVIDGDALLLTLRDCHSCIGANGGRDKNKCACSGSIRMDLLALARMCKAVIACRCGPKQKSLLVDLVRANTPGSKTLSIGDGANDVPMIQTAHIGVGISGQEGMQAVNAADYAVGQASASPIGRP
jgi:phospholipid-transporting ATPase